MATDSRRPDEDDPFHIFCQKFGLNVQENAEISEVIKDDEAFRQALIELNPTLQTALSKKFMRILVDHALLVNKNSGNAPVAKPSYSKISKKEIRQKAIKVAKLSEKLHAAIKALLELAVPASLALPVDQNDRTDTFHDNLFVALPQKAKEIIAVRDIALACRYKFETVGTKRDINPIDPLQQSFANNLARIWKQAGYAVKTSVESSFDQFFCLSYQAVSGGDDHSSSATSRSQALIAAREFVKNPDAFEIRNELAVRARHTMTFNESYLNRSQIVASETGNLEDLEDQVF